MLSVNEPTLTSQSAAINSPKATRTKATDFLMNRLNTWLKIAPDKRVVSMAVCQKSVDMLTRKAIHRPIQVS